MKKEDIKHLANLSRLELTDEELESYSKDMTSIIDYVNSLKDLKTSDEGRIESISVRNEFREDGEPHEAGLYTEDLLESAPESQDGFVKVKKILNN